MSASTLWVDAAPPTSMALERIVSAGVNGPIWFVLRQHREEVVFGWSLVEAQE